MSAFGDVVCPYCGCAYLETDPHDCHHQDMKCRIDDLLEENERLRRALQDIADDPIISEYNGCKRGVEDILRIARAALRGEVE